SPPPTCAGRHWRRPGTPIAPRGGRRRWASSLAGAGASRTCCGMRTRSGHCRSDDSIYAAARDVASCRVLAGAHQDMRDPNARASPRAGHSRRLVAITGAHPSQMKAVAADGEGWGEATLGRHCKPTGRVWSWHEIAALLNLAQLAQLGAGFGNFGGHGASLIK